MIIMTKQLRQTTEEQRRPKRFMVVLQLCDLCELLASRARQFLKRSASPHRVPAAPPVGPGLGGDVVTAGWIAWQAIVHGGRRPVGPRVRKC